MTCHVVPATLSPLLKSSISAVYSDQYLPMICAAA
jgi:hypothetical protein